MTELHGITGAPYDTPQVRKAMPAPFTRDRIDLDGGRQVKRSWKDVPIQEIKVGDVVADVGRITKVDELIRIPDVDEVAELAAQGEKPQVIWQVRLVNAMGTYWDFPGHQRLYAFTRDLTHLERRKENGVD